MDKHILVFGDSITQGFWDLEGGWVQRLRKYIDTKNLADPDNDLWILFNLGISGDRTEDVLDRFEKETEARTGDKNVFIFSIGSNDCEFNNIKNELKISKNEFRTNITKLINLAKKHSSEIIFTGFFPVDESKVDPIPWYKDYSYLNKYTKEYETIVKEICKENGIHFIELFDKFIDSNYQELLTDGVHPDSEGHKRIFEIVRDYLVKEKLI